MKVIPTLIYISGDCGENTKVAITWRQRAAVNVSLKWREFMIEDEDDEQRTSNLGVIKKNLLVQRIVSGILENNNNNNTCISEKILKSLYI